MRHGPFAPPVGGSSVNVCAGRIVEKAKKIAAEMMEVAAEDLSYESGSFIVPGTEIAPLAFAKVARMAYLGHVLPVGMEPGLDETLFYDPSGMGAPSGVHMAYVEVDPDTGTVEILDYVASTMRVRSSTRCLRPGKSMAEWSRASDRRSMRRCATTARPASC